MSGDNGTMLNSSLIRESCAHRSELLKASACDLYGLRGQSLEVY